MSGQRLQTRVFVPLTEEASVEALQRKAARLLKLPVDGISSVRVVRRSLDVRRRRRAGYHLSLEVVVGDPPPLTPRRWPRYRLQAPVRVVIAGSGPAGSFAALRLAESGADVAICELGKAVPDRRRDVARLVRSGELDPHSNYCFGEGGAGTFSDGKLYTRAKARDAVDEVLARFVELGANPSIQVDARPHLGSDQLPKIVLALRARLEALGVRYHFSDPLVDLVMGKAGVTQVQLSSGAVLPCDRLILAAGHSARPLYATLVDKGLACQPKPFAVGARVEHPQPLINTLQYGPWAGSPKLPPAFYHLTAQVTEAGQTRGVYSFCMCPGGWVVDSATEMDRLCTNGMSFKRRDAPLANAALVVTVEPADVAAYGRYPGDPLAGVFFQRQLEAQAYAQGGGGFRAAAQRLTDFVGRRATTVPAPSSYRPGVVGGDVAAVLPTAVAAALRAAIPHFERTMPGFLTAEAQLVGVETRTSSPLRLLRDPQTYASPTHPGVYPCGEGAGYSGGIVSAAIDGLRVAEAIIRAAPKTS